MKATCFKCKKEVEVKNEKFVVNKIGGIAIAGQCPHCGTNITRLVKGSLAPKDIQEKSAKIRASKKSARKGGAARKSRKRSHKKSNK